MFFFGKNFADPTIDQKNWSDIKCLFSHDLEMKINFSFPTLELFCFSFAQPFIHSKFCLTQPFSLRCHPCHEYQHPAVYNKGLQNTLFCC
jgi:hypothetical protein